MKKSIIALIIFALFFASALNAFDFGGIFSNYTGVTIVNSAPGLDQDNNLSLWFKAPIGKNGYFATEGGYSFSYDGAGKSFTNELDLSLFKANWTFNTNAGKITLDLGRFISADCTGIIFNQNSDGLFAQFAGDSFSMFALASYTGLLNAHGATYYFDQTNIDYSKLYPLAPKYVITGIAATFPFLFAEQSLTTEFWGFFDVNGNPAPYNRIMGTASLNGNITSSLFYTFSDTVCYDSKISDLAIANITYFIEKLNSSVSLNVTFATGENSDPESKIGGFTPFNLIACDVTGTKAYDGIIKTGISGTCQPVSKLLLTGGFDYLMSYDDKYITDGIQWTTTALWQLYSDLELSVTASQYIPLAASTAESYFQAQAGIVISF